MSQVCPRIGVSCLLLADLGYRHEKCKLNDYVSNLRWRSNAFQCNANVGLGRVKEEIVLELTLEISLKAHLAKIQATGK